MFACLTTLNKIAALSETGRDDYTRKNRVYR